MKVFGNVGNNHSVGYKEETKAYRLSFELTKFAILPGVKVVNTVSSPLLEECLNSWLLSLYY